MLAPRLRAILGAFLMATWAQKFPGTLSPICQADWPQHCPQYRGLFWWQSGPQNFQALWLPSSRQAGPNIACDIRGSFAGNLGPKTSRHFGSHVAPNIRGIFAGRFGPKLPGSSKPTFAPKSRWYTQNMAGYIRELGGKMQSMCKACCSPKVHSLLCI